jgi:hypothetical protein
MRRQWGHFTRQKAPRLHTEPGCSDPPPHSRRPPWATDWTMNASHVVVETSTFVRFVAGFSLELRLPKYSREYFGNYSAITYKVEGTIDKAIIAVNF